MGMLFLIILLLCLPSLTAAHPQQQQQQPSSPCGAGSPPRDFHHMTRKFRVQETTANRSSTWSKMRVSGSRMPVQINTYIHVLAADFTPNGGYASVRNNAPSPPKNNTLKQEDVEKRGQDEEEEEDEDEDMPFPRRNKIPMKMKM